MSLEIEGAINRNTAAILALAITIERNNGVRLRTAEDNVEKRFKTMLETDGPVLGRRDDA